MKRLLIIFVFASFMLGCKTNKKGGPSAQKYAPNWESLSQHNAEPEWLKDAKLGIYFHWGPYSVPAYSNEWYPRHMYIEGHKAHRHHLETYGADVHYHDFVPMFTAEHFDAEDWAELFKQSGAKFAGPVAEHHDGFSMWDSEITPWNAVDKGPQQDILGSLFKSLEKRGMKTIATFHHARNLQRYTDKWEEEVNKDVPSGRKFKDSHYPYYPEYQDAFSRPEVAALYGSIPEDQWNESIWLGKLKEVIDQYQPDIIWFDSWLDRVPESYRQRFAAYYLNAAEEWDKEVVIVRKQKDLPLEVSINDHEKSREPKALKELWMTDDTYSTGSWCYTEDLKLKPTSKVLHGLIDAVSKNGILLLNISPKADGTIPDNQRAGLLELGGWLKENGDAIYNTRPWVHAAEGPTSEPSGGFSSAKKFMKLHYSVKDIRYTMSKDKKTVYAITLGVPADGDKVLLSTFSDENFEVESVSSISGEQFEWLHKDEGLEISAENISGDLAYVFKIKLK